MISSVLRSRRAVEVSIAIMRTFVRLRQMLATNEELARKLPSRGVAVYDRPTAQAARRIGDLKCSFRMRKPTEHRENVPQKPHGTGFKTLDPRPTTPSNRLLNQMQRCPRIGCRFPFRLLKTPHSLRLDSLDHHVLPPWVGQAYQTRTAREEKWPPSRA